MLATTSPRTPQLQQKQKVAALPQEKAPGRNPSQPYVNHHASLASLARHMMMSIPQGSETVTVKSGELREILSLVLRLGFGTPGGEKYAADLSVAAAEAIKGNADRAME